jgi:DNA-binding SARP family transcriptional activator
MARSARIQVCGRVRVEVDGVRRDDLLPGPQGRRALAFLVVRRHDPVSRDALVDALWSAGPPASVDAAVHALVSKLRRVVPIAADRVGLRLELPPGAWVDIEAARDSLHRAESALARGDWGRAWGAAQTALFTARRGFLPGEAADWADGVRAELELIHQRALEAYATAALEIGRTESPTAERAGRELVGLAPFRESGHRLLMRALAAQGNSAEALRVYEALARRLREELGVAPGEETRALHAQVLAGLFGSADELNSPGTKRSRS